MDCAGRYWLSFFSSVAIQFFRKVDAVSVVNVFVIYPLSAHNSPSRYADLHALSMLSHAGG
jgi:hypothetical protein